MSSRAQQTVADSTGSFNESGRPATLPRAGRRGGVRGSATTAAGSETGVRLLDIDPDLGSELSELERAEAQRRVVLPMVTLDTGGWELGWLDHASGVRGRVRGFLVLSGGVTSDLLIAGRLCTRLIGPQELVLLDPTATDSISVSFDWSVLVPARLAILDDRLLTIARAWPGLVSAILSRSAQTIHNASLQQAISQLPRVEDRLLALLWTLADRQGVVRSDGVWLELPASHAILAQMVGARRPTVSLALRALCDQGSLRSERGGWLIDRASLAHFLPSGGRDAQVPAAAAEDTELSAGQQSTHPISAGHTSLTPAPTGPLSGVASTGSPPRRP